MPLIQPFVLGSDVMWILVVPLTYAPPIAVLKITFPQGLLSASREAAPILVVVLQLVLLSPAPHHSGQMMPWQLRVVPRVVVAKVSAVKALVRESLVVEASSTSLPSLVLLAEQSFVVFQIAAILLVQFLIFTALRIQFPKDLQALSLAPELELGLRAVEGIPAVRLFAVLRSVVTQDTSSISPLPENHVLVRSAPLRSAVNNAHVQALASYALTIGPLNLNLNLVDKLVQRKFAATTSHQLASLQEVAYFCVPLHIFPSPMLHHLFVKHLAMFVQEMSVVNSHAPVLTVQL
jgi:hypothetical protein